MVAWKSALNWVKQLKPKNLTKLKQIKLKIDWIYLIEKNNQKWVL